MHERGEFRVSVTKESLVFSSAHFITFAGHRCEGLHGHNYRARVMVEGVLGPDSLVFDFLDLKKIMERLCHQLDHVVLLPLHNPRIQVTERGDNVNVAVDGKPRYTFPRRDCVLLPIPNTTVELLAELIANQLRSELNAVGAHGLSAIDMELEESFGQAATYTVKLKGEN